MNHPPRAPPSQGPPLGTSPHGRTPVRRATAADLPVLDAMSAELHAHERITTPAAQRQAALAELLRDPSKGYALVAERALGPIGYAAVATCHSIEFGGTAALLDELWVDPHLRGQGVGQALVTACAKASGLLGHRCLRLEVGHGNPAARRLYERLGFQAHQRDLLTLHLGT